MTAITANDIQGPPQQPQAAQVTQPPEAIVKHAIVYRKPRKWIGVVGIVKLLLFGSVEEDGMANADHVAWIRKLGRLLSTPLLVSLSAGALFTIGKYALNATLKATASGHIFSLDDIISIAFLIMTGLFVLGLDVLMIIRSVDMSDKISQKSGFLAWLPDLLTVLFGGFIESVTYGMLIVSQEHPQTTGDWFLVILRATAVPVVAISLATLADRILTDKEMTHRLDVQNANAISSTLDMIKATPAIENLPLLLSFRRWLRDGDEDAKKKDEELIHHIEAMMPDAIALQAKTQIDVMKNEMQSAQQTMQMEIESIKNEAEKQVQEVMRQTLPALLYVLEHQEWPPELLAMAPEYHSIQPALILKRAGIGMKKSGNSTIPVSASPADDLRILCDSQRVKVIATITDQNKNSKKTKGVWIKSSDIVAISGEALTQQEATEMAARLGNSSKTGVTYAAPLKQILKELMRRNQLAEPWLTWQKQHESDQNTEELSDQSIISMSTFS